MAKKQKKRPTTKGVFIPLSGGGKSYRAPGGRTASRTSAVLVDSDGAPGLSFDGMEELERALKRPGSIDDALRGDLLELLDYLLFMVATRPRRGRKREYYVSLAAAVAQRFVERGASVKDAVFAVVKHARYAGRVKAARKKLLRSGDFWDEKYIDRIADTLTANLPHKFGK